MIDTNRYVSNSGELRLMNNLNRIFKNFESFVQNSVQLTSDGTKSKNWGGRGMVGAVWCEFEWGYGCVFLVTKMLHDSDVRVKMWVKIS